MSETLLCTECKYSFRNWSDFIIPKRYALKCRLAFREEKVEIDPVIGRKVTPAYYEGCNLARMDHLGKHNDQEGCGKDGKFWQPKHKSGLFKLIKKEHSNANTSN